MQPVSSTALHDDSLAKYEARHVVPMISTCQRSRYKSRQIAGMAVFGFRGACGVACYLACCSWAVARHSMALLLLHGASIQFTPKLPACMPCIWCSSHIMFCNRAQRVCAHSSTLLLVLLPACMHAGSRSAMTKTSGRYEGTAAMPQPLLPEWVVGGAWL